LRGVDKEAVRRDGAGFPPSGGAGVEGFEFAPSDSVDRPGGFKFDAATGPGAGELARTPASVVGAATVAFGLAAEADGGFGDAPYSASNRAIA
jgi:hypothetical protein